MRPPTLRFALHMLTIPFRDLWLASGSSDTRSTKGITLFEPESEF